MNEHIARDVVLVRAIETADRNKEILSDDDRKYASRSARELAQWQASDKQAEATTDDFLQQRSDLILKKLAERTPAFAAFARRRNGMQGFALALPIIAMLLGAGLDRITDPHRVDLLSAPLLLIIVWNLLVYLGLLIWLVIPPRPWAVALLRRFSVGKPALPRKMPAVLSAALLEFMNDWARLSAKLTSLRLSRTIHLSAAMFALGAVLSLYARGVLSQYAAGWESTFLDAGQVHHLLSLIFAPATAIFQLRGFSLADVQALRFPQTTTVEGGARWVHLYAGTILLLVVVPRLLLAAVSHWRASRLAQRFPLDLDQPYFRKLNDAIGLARGGTLRVLPYSFTVDEARHQGLMQIAVMLFGEQGQVMLRPSTAYGEEPQDVLTTVNLNDNGATLTAVLFNLTATPEQENHGAFLDHLVKLSPRGIAVLLDESAYTERAADPVRLAERTALWMQFCSFHQTTATVVNLLNAAARPIDGLTLSAAA